MKYGPISDENLEAAIKYRSAEDIDILRMAEELKELRALLATPMWCGWEVPIADDDEENGGKLVRWGGDTYEEPDEAIALGAALIRAALEAKEGK